MKATIIKKQLIADNTLYIEFALKSPMEFRAGQWFFLELLNPIYQDERGATRHFTIVNPPEEKNQIAMATRLSESAFKKSLNELAIGADVELSGPLGEFLLPEKNTDLMMIAGGIGITPFMSQLNHINNLNLNYKIKLLYFNRNQQSTAFFNELNTLKNQLINFEVIFIMSETANWSGETGNISSEIINKYSTSLNDPLYMVVGPPKMIEASLIELKKLDIPNNMIITENFTGY